MCICGVLAMYMFLIFFVHFRCNFCSKMFFFTRLVPVSRPGVFLLTPWAPLSCAGVFILHLCGNRTCTFTAGVFSYPRAVHFFGKRIFGRQLLKQRPRCGCKCNVGR